MEAMLNLVNVLVREKMAGCARCSGDGTAGSTRDESYESMLRLVNAHTRERKAANDVEAALRQTIQVRLQPLFKHL